MVELIAEIPSTKAAFYCPGDSEGGIYRRIPFGWE